MPSAATHIPTDPLEATLPGPSRTITVEPIEVPREDPIPTEWPEESPRPEEAPRQPEKEPEKVPA